LPLKREKFFCEKLFENPVGFGQAPGKIGQESGFSSIFRIAFPKPEVLGKPPFK
jgi:hypothetical protein